MIELNNDTCKLLKEICLLRWPDKIVNFNFNGNEKFFYITTSLINESGVPNDLFHYEYNPKGNGQFAFHIEEDGNEDLLNLLWEKRPNCAEYQWNDWQGRINQSCRLINHRAESIGDVLDAFNKLINIFDDVLLDNKHMESSPDKENQNSHSVSNVSENLEPEIGTSVIEKLPWDKLNIPEYQRPYKWTSKNVNQLISDIISFKDQSVYRLGTLVLHSNNGKLDIVDGQQRIVTIALLLSYLFKSNDGSQFFKNHIELKRQINDFCSRIEFNNSISFKNCINNWNAIETRKPNLTQDFFDTLINKCEFVTIQLSDISEAFQFFDSQNSRGKDLEPHDLLKAYHLREIDSRNMSETDKKNLSLWQSQSTDFLRRIFLILYKVKRWPLGEQALNFKKQDIGIFKGVSLNDDKWFPFYQLEIIAHVYIENYMKSSDRIVDGSHLEYPYNLDDQIINGSRFFDMIRHYLLKIEEVWHSQKGSLISSKESQASKILELIQSYNGCYRIGDRYVQDLFYITLLYYIDRFGIIELDRIIPKIFLWAFSCRLKNKSVRKKSVDNYALGKDNIDSMFRIIHQAHTPDDITNVVLPRLNSKEECSKCDEIKEMFKKYNLLK